MKWPFWRRGRGDRDKRICIRAVSAAAAQATESAIDELIAAGMIKNGELRKLLLEEMGLIKSVGDLVHYKFARSVEILVGYLRLLYRDHKIVVKATDGKENAYGASDVFEWIDPDFMNNGHAFSEPARPQTRAEVFETIKDGTPFELFNSLTDDFERLCWTQHQVNEFARSYAVLMPPGRDRMNLFLRKDQKTCEFCTSVIKVDDNGVMRIFDFPLEREYVLVASSRHRLIVPALWHQDK